MNLKDLHSDNKAVSAHVLFKGQTNNTMSIEFKKDALLKEHESKVPAILLCVQGSLIYQEHDDVKITLHPGDYTQIAPFVKHWVTALEDSQAVLIR